MINCSTGPNCTRITQKNVGRTCKSILFSGLGGIMVSALASNAETREVEFILGWIVFHDVQSDSWVTKPDESWPYKPGKVMAV